MDLLRRIIDPIRLLSLVESAMAGVPLALVRGVITAESNGRSVVTPEPGGRFSYGVMQVLPDTARFMGYHGPDAWLVWPENSIRYGCRYLRWQLDRYDGDWRLAVSAYNAGTATDANSEYVDRVMANLYG